MGVKNHMCDLCGKGFYRKEYLTSHLAHHSAGTGDRALKKQRASESTHQGQSHHHDEDEEEEEETDDSVCCSYDCMILLLLRLHLVLFSLVIV